MIRFELQSFRAEHATEAAAFLRKIAERIEEGETNGVEFDTMSEGAKFDVTELCEFCDGERFINGKKCFNCNEPDYGKDGE